MASEFDLIAKYFQQPFAQLSAGLALPNGDDCALLNLEAGQQLAVSADTLLPGVHFFADAPAAEIAQRALRVNLSDLAAMGAEPLGFTLALTLPEVNEPWLQGFSAGLLAAASEYDVPLLGGDTTRGPLCITIQVLGQVPTGQALTRGGARAGDGVFVSGTLGDAAAFLELKDPSLEGRYFRPRPRLQLGQALRQQASACVDISDGLLQDLGHICRASGLGAELAWEQIPLSALLQQQPLDKQQRWALTGGDDYELCFTAPPDFSFPHCTRIGRLVAGASDVRITYRQQPLSIQQRGYQHF